MKTLKLIIMLDGRASTINPLELPDPFNTDESEQEYFEKFQAYRKAEAQRKSYEIDDCGMSCECVPLSGWQKCLQPGTIVEVEIIDENTVRVVKIVKE